MQAKIRSAEKKNNRSIYLEVYIEENGKVIFANLTGSEVILVKKISRKKRQAGEFYCG